MQRTIGVLATRHIWLGMVENHKLVDTHIHPQPGEPGWDLTSMHPEDIAGAIRDVIARAAGGEGVRAVGVAFPGVIRDGVVEECPNYPQMKGFRLQASLEAGTPVRIFNDTDAMAAGVAATRGQLENLIRVWYLSDGVGFGRYPQAEGIWEGGHSVVTLDPRERYCGCGGVGHLEGIMGHRAMRLRFLDLEPEEVFADAGAGDARCADFVKLWHRALAAATATSIHMDGPGKFFLLGPNTEFVDLHLLGRYVQEMVAMSSLQGSTFDVVESSHELGLIGAAVNAEQAG